MKIRHTKPQHGLALRWKQDVCLCEYLSSYRKLLFNKIEDCKDSALVLVEVGSGTDGLSPFNLSSISNLLSVSKKTVTQSRISVTAYIYYIEIQPHTRG